MQDIRERRRDENGDVTELRSVIVGYESPGLMEQFRAKRKEVEDRMASGETESATIVEARRIGRNDPCPCNSGIKFKKCCGVNFKPGDARLAN